MKGINEADGRILVATAREAIVSALKYRAPEYPTPTPSLLAARGGLFVSLHRSGNLRGCIGRMSSPLPLVEIAKSMAAAAAFEDPRFEPLARAELADLEVEITVLGELFRISGSGDFEVGRHGLFIVSRGRSGVLLPQVAVEYGWSPETFLAQVCWKAGLDPSEWKSPGAELYAFEGAVFG